MLGIDAVAHEQYGEALRRRGSGGSGSGLASLYWKRVQPGEGHCHAGTSKEGAAREVVRVRLWHGPPKADAGRRMGDSLTPILPPVGTIWSAYSCSNMRVPHRSWPGVRL